MHFFFLNFFDPSRRFFFLAWVLTVLISIVLHELAHGWAAIRLGDPTPRLAGHLTGNPAVHMGPWSLAALLLVGLAWGRMPVDGTRLRGRYAEAQVALAGPAANLVLALLAFTALGLSGRWAPAPEAGWAQNGVRLLEIAGRTNVVLCLFNLAPLPPLDGARVLANLNAGYARMLADPGKRGVFFAAFVLFFIFAGRLFELATEVRDFWVGLF